MYVPFLDVLRNILKIPEVLKCVLERPNITANKYTSYQSGQKNGLFETEIFSIQIGFYDNELPLQIYDPNFAPSSIIYSLPSCADTLACSILALMRF